MRVVVSISTSNTSNSMNDNEKKRTPGPEQQKFECSLCLYRALSRMIIEKQVSRVYWPQYTEAQLEDLRDQAWLELVDAMPFEAVLDIEDLLTDLNISIAP